MLSLCLSRACLGKMIRFKLSIKWHRKRERRFLTARRKCSEILNRARVAHLSKSNTAAIETETAIKTEAQNTDSKPSSRSVICKDSAAVHRYKCARF